MLIDAQIRVTRFCFVGAYNSGPNIISQLGEDETFLTAAAKFVQEKYIQQSGGNIQFALMALVMGQGD